MGLRQTRAAWQRHRQRYLATLGAIVTAVTLIGFGMSLHTSSNTSSNGGGTTIAPPAPALGLASTSAPSPSPPSIEAVTDTSNGSLTSGSVPLTSIPAPTTTAPVWALPVSDSSACRSPTQATGADWREGTLSFKGEIVTGYHCSVARGVTGTLDFDLAGRYTTFAALVGLSDSPSSEQQVIFEVFGDGSNLVSTPGIDYKGGQTISADVTGVRRLQLKITEAHRSGGDDSTSEAFFASMRVG